jgi:hypothetical protein
MANIFAGVTFVDSSDVQPGRESPSSALYNSSRRALEGKFQWALLDFLRLLFLVKALLPYTIQISIISILKAIRVINLTNRNQIISLDHHAKKVSRCYCD